MTLVDQGRLALDDPVARYLRNSKAAVIYEGTSQLHTLIQADYLLGYREDHPLRDDDHWLKHSLGYSEGNRLEYKSVQMKPLSVESVPPKARTF